MTKRKDELPDKTIGLKRRLVIHFSEGLVALTSIAAIVALALFVLGMRVRRHPPEVSEASSRRLSVGLIFALACSLLLTFSYFMWMLIWPIKPSPFFVILALGGNVLNLVIGIYSSRELCPECLVAGLLIGLEQALWILFALLTLTVDF